MINNALLILGILMVSFKIFFNRDNLKNDDIEGELDYDEAKDKINDYLKDLEMLQPYLSTKDIFNILIFIPLLIVSMFYILCSIRFRIIWIILINIIFVVHHWLSAQIISRVLIKRPKFYFTEFFSIAESVYIVFIIAIIITSYVRA